MARELRELGPRVSEFPVAGGEARSIEYPVLAPVQQGLYVTKEDTLVVQFLGDTGGSDVEVIYRQFVPGFGIQIERRVVKTVDGPSRQMYWLPLSEGWLVNITVNDADGFVSQGEARVRIGLERGWGLEGHAVMWFAEGPFSHITPFFWPGPTYYPEVPEGIRDRVDVEDVENWYYYWWIDEPDWFEIEGMYIEFTPADSTPSIDMYVTTYLQGVIAQGIAIPFKIDSNMKYIISLINWYPGWYKVENHIFGPMAIPRALTNGEGIGVMVSGYENIPKFDRIRIFFRRIM